MESSGLNPMDCQREAPRNTADSSIDCKIENKSTSGESILIIDHSTNEVQIDKIEKEDFEEETRLIKNCSKAMPGSESASKSTLSVSSGSSPSEEKVDFPGCSSKDYSHESDSNATIRNMLKSRKCTKSYKIITYHKKSENECSISQSEKNSFCRAKCNHLRIEREECARTSEKSTQLSLPHHIIEGDEFKGFKQLNMMELLATMAPSSSRPLDEPLNFESETKDDESSQNATKSFLQEYYNDGDTDDEEHEAVWCTCQSSDDENSDEDIAKSDSEENRAWRKRLYEPTTSMSTGTSPSKKFCTDPSTSASTNRDNSWLANLQSAHSIPLNVTTGPPELKQWLNRFNTWSNPERIQAIDALISRSAVCQVRYMMNVIEPLFQRDFISLLPKELALTVLAYLEPEDLVRAAQTCRYWRFLADDNLIWREQCRRVGITSLKRKTRSTPFNSSPWKAAYMRQHMIESNWVTRPVNEPIIMKGHDDHVITCLQFYGNRIVSGSDDTTLKVWSAVSGRCLKTLVGHTGGVWSSQMYGHLVISGSTDRTLRVWNAKTGQCLKVLAGHTSTVRCMHLYKDRVVSGSRDATLRVWSIPEGRCMRVLVGHLAAVRCVQYDGKVVVSGAYDYFVKIWNPDTGECLHTLAGHTNRVYSLQFDGVHIVSGSLDTSIRVWEVENGQLKHTLIGHQSLTSGMELHSNILVSGNADSTVKVWDISTGHCLHTLSGANKHQSAVTCLQSTERFVITSSDDGTVKLWDVRTGEFIRNLVELGSGGSGGVVWRIRASPTKLVCAVGSRNGTEETKLLVLNFDLAATCYKCTQ